MAIEIREVKTHRELDQFIKFPFSIYKKSLYWIPPLFLDEFKFHNPKNNKALRTNDSVLFTCYKDGKISGRVMGIISKTNNEQIGKHRARFFKYDSIDDQEVAHALIGAVENWALGRGMNEIIGPFGFSDKDPQGFLIRGYDVRAAIVASYNYPYYNELIEREGYTKEIDLVEYDIPVPEKIPEFYERIYQRVTRNQDIKVLKFRNKKELRPYIIPVLELMNETFREVYGSYDLDREEMEKFAEEYMTILDVDYVILVADKGMPVGFFIALPDLGPGLQKAKGRLFPFGIFHLMKQMKKTDFIVLMLGGIKPGHQGLGLDVLMGIKMLEAASKRGIKHINTHLELEDNFKVRGEMERMGGKVCKMHRIYVKTLSSH